MITAREIIDSPVWKGAIEAERQSIIEEFLQADIRDSASLMSIAADMNALKRMIKSIEARLEHQSINQR